jgi:hypothetical protein
LGRKTHSCSCLTQVEVASTQPTNVIVALGDPITEGYGSTNNAFRGWTDRLAERLAERPGKQPWAVLKIQEFEVIVCSAMVPVLMHWHGLTETCWACPASRP